MENILTKSKLVRASWLTLVFLVLVSLARNTRANDGKPRFQPLTRTEKIVYDDCLEANGIAPQKNFWKDGQRETYRYCRAEALSDKN